jgi:hypothetical protein
VAASTTLVALRGGFKVYGSYSQSADQVRSFFAPNLTTVEGDLLSANVVTTDRMIGGTSYVLEHHMVKPIVHQHPASFLMLSCWLMSTLLFHLVILVYPLLLLLH